MSLRLIGSGSRRARWAVGGFLAVSLAVAFTAPGISAAGAATAAHPSRAAHPITTLVPRPHGPVHHINGNLIYHGGPVQNAPRVFIDFWGWTTDPSGERPYLTSFLQGIGGSSWLSTVSQYGGGWTGTLLAGTWNHKVLRVPSHPTDAQIQAEAVRADTHFAAGTSVNVEIVVATPHGHSTSGFGTQWCAYHGAVSAHPNITYTNLPYMSDAGFSCGEGSVNSPGTLDGVSIVEGHELAETITDPQLNAWYDASGSEIGDLCAWINLQNITISTGTFPVQPLWSNAAGGCVG